MVRLAGGRSLPVITSLLAKAAEKGAERLGESAASAALAALKARLTHTGAQAALTDLTTVPDDKAAQGALEIQLRKALHAEPSFADFLQAWTASAQAAQPTAQQATVTGDHNQVTQIVGSHNRVS